MQLTEIRIEDFKALKLSFNWSPVTVFFGRNDVGKSNALEALALLFADTGRDDLSVRHDPYSDPRRPPYLRHSSKDRDITAYIHVSYRIAGEFSPGELIDVLHSGGSHFFPSQEVASVLERWTGMTAKDMVDPEQVVPVLVDAALESVADDLEDHGQHEMLRSVLSWALDSCRFDWHLNMDGDAGAWWLSPPSQQLPPHIRSAAESLVFLAAAPETDNLDVDEDFAGDAVRRIIEGLVSHGECFIEQLSSEVDIVLFDVVHHVVSNAQRHDLLAQRYEDVVAEASLYSTSDLAILLESPTRWTPRRLSNLRHGLDAWLEQDESTETYHVREHLRKVCEWLERRATELAPPFIQELYSSLSVEILPPTRWADGGRRILLCLRRGDRAIRFDMAGSGVAIWVAFAFEQALFELRQRMRGGRSGIRCLYIIDEPEHHLHPRAQAEIAAFIARIAERGADVVLATHSPALLNIPYQTTNYLHTDRDQNGLTVVQSISEDTLRHLEKNLDQTGLSRADLLFLTRGVLLVEGEQDRLVLEALYGEELSTSRIRVLAFSGAHQTLALLDSTLLRSLHIPIFILLDNTRQAILHNLVNDRFRPGPTPSMEELQLIKLKTFWRGRDQFPELLPFEYPDIVCALPDDAIRSVIPSFPGWNTVVSSYRQLKHRENFKDYLLRTTAAGIGVSDVLRGALDALADLPPAAHLPLDAAIQRITARTRVSTGTTSDL